MIRAASLCAFLSLAALPATAETAAIRSGEHTDHSRIVVEPGEPTSWVLGRSESGYVLRFDRAGIDFDTADVFRLIPRTRLSALAPAGDSALALTVAPGHHARAFETPRGVAIDIYTGPAPADSPFEAPLPAPGTATAAQAPVQAPAALASTVPTQAAAAPLVGPASAPAQPATDPSAMPERARISPPSRPPVIAALASAAAAIRGEPALAAPAPATMPTPRPRPEPVATVAQPPQPAPVGEPETAPATAPAPQTVIAQRPARTPVAPDPLLDLYWRSTLAPETAAAAPSPAPAPVAEAAQIPAPEPAAAPQTLPITVNPRVAEAETELLRQLSRAASQGLVRADVPELRPTAPETEMATGTTAEEEAPAATAEDRLADHLNIHSNTSIDRELAGVRGNGPVTAEGRECLPDSALAVSDWADERPMLLQLSELRTGLLGEFDRPSPEAVEALVKLYLHFGFGAEARTSIEAFGDNGRLDDVYLDIAAILDFGHGDPGGRLATMIDCDTSATLWGLLAREDVGPADTVNEEAALRAFSALPLHLRRTLGELLAERFLQIGEPGRARAVRDAILRAPGEHGIAISMIDARLELTRGDGRAAEPLLEEVARANGPQATEAVILYIDSRLRDGLPVDRGMVTNAGALAFESKGAPEAPALERAHVLGLASNGDFAEAFAALARWRKDGLHPLQATVKDELFAMLAAPEASGLFLTHYFANRDLIRPEEASADLRLALSERLLSFGLTDEARRMRGNDASRTETGRLFLARAALADYDGAEALRQIDGFDGTEARRLRADALRLLGLHHEAVEAYLASGAPAQAGQEAWRAGDWEEVAELDDGLRREAVTAFGLVPGVTPPPLAPPAEPGPDGEPPGPLAQNRALLEESRAARAMIDALLADAGTLIETPEGDDG
ncbi:MAG: hypothetical protein NXH83_03350 [Rhodobacteraceae bacterium]|nr:hypothetical protein [Paracoccaceae bacterium]